MQVGAFTQYIDVAQVLLYVFWIFFILLVLWLHREGKREGYPLRSDASDRITVQGFPAMPEPKTYETLHGTTTTLPNDRNDDDRDINATALGGWHGAPLKPNGNPMIDGLGAAAWADRADVPDLTLHGEPKIQPMTMLGDNYAIAEGSIDPVGMPVIAHDGEQVGTVSDIWIDTMEQLTRYYEVQLDSGSKVLVPMMLAHMKKRGYADADGPLDDRLLSRNKRHLHVASITSAQFADAPTPVSTEQITLLEEDKIQAYFGGGHVFATRKREEALF